MDAKKARRRSALWKGFEVVDPFDKDSGGRLLVECEYCKCSFRARNRNLIIHRSKCEKMPDELRDVPYQPRQKQPNSMASPKRKLKTTNKTPNKSPVKRNIITIDEGIVSMPYKPMSTQVTSKMDMEDVVHNLIARIMVKNDLPLDLLDCDLFRDLFRRGFPHLNHITREKFTTYTIPKIYNELEREQITEIANSKGWTISIDSWTDISGISYYNIVLVDLGRAMYVGTVNITEQHSADLLQTELERIISIVMEPSIAVAIVSDSLDVLIKMQKTICNQFKHIVPLECFLESMNMVCKDILHFGNVAQYANDLISVVAFFNYSAYWREQLSSWAHMNNIGDQCLVPYRENRWYTFIQMCQSIILFQDGLKHCLSQNLDLADNVPNISPKVVDILNNAELLPMTQLLLDVVKPILDIIEQMEKETLPLTFVWETLYQLNYHFEQLKTQSLDHEFFQMMVHVAQNSLNRRAMNYNEPIYIVAFFLIPRYRKIVISKRFTVKQIKTYIIEIAHKWACYHIEEAQRLPGQIDLYIADEPPHMGTDIDALKYWQDMKMSDKSHILKDFAMRLLKLVAHTLRADRIMPINSLAATKTMNRLNADLSTAHMKIKIDLAKTTEHGHSSTSTNGMVAEGDVMQLGELCYEDFDCDFISELFDMNQDLYVAKETKVCKTEPISMHWDPTDIISLI